MRRDDARIRCFTRNGHDWADRVPAIVDAAKRIKAVSFLIDGEAVIACHEGRPDFRGLRGKRRGHEAVLFAVDLIEHDGANLRDLPPIERKRRLARLPRRAKHAIRFNEHLMDDGPTVFDHVCRMGLEGIVSKRTDAPYRRWTVQGVDQVEEPSQRGGAAGTGGRVEQLIKPHSSNSSHIVLRVRGHEATPDPEVFASARSAPCLPAGLWTPWRGVRGPKSAPVDGQHELFGFLTTEANGVVAPIHPKGMPVILTTPEEVDLWLLADAPKALQLQRPLLDDVLQIVASGEKEDGPREATTSVHQDEERMLPL